MYMNQPVANTLALINDILQAVIVIFGSAVILYNLNRIRRDRVTRAFCTLLAFVNIVYLTELMVSRTIVTVSAETWLRLEWVGIAMVPAAQYHLSDTLLTVTGAPPNRRRLFVPVAYLIGLIFLALVLATDLVVAELVRLPRAPHLNAGVLFPVFALYFWLLTAVSILNVWRARQRSITRSTRHRLTMTLLAFWAPPLGVFPYMLLSGNVEQNVPLFFWPFVISGNILVGFMLAVLTSNLIYFGSLSPDRVVRVRLYKFMARVPLAGTIVLLVYVLVSRSSPVLGLPTETALGFALVATVMLVEWAIHAYKRPLERLFQLNSDPEVRHIQELSERLLTTRDLQQFLEIVLAATCETLRTPTAFVAAITPEGPRLEAVIGPLTEPEQIWEEANWQELAQSGNNENGQQNLQTVDGFFLWRNYWIRPLYNQNRNTLLGIFGIRARAHQPDLTETEQTVLERLFAQAETALEDRVLQQGVFAAVEGLLPQITALQARRGAAKLGGLPALTADATATDTATLVTDPEFKSMVRDALSHYWGGPKLTESPLMRLQIVQKTAAEEYDNNPVNALRAILTRAIELQKPEGERNLTRMEWLLYNILELKFIQGKRVRDVARRLAMSESDLYRKQRVAIENVARTIASMELEMVQEEALQPTEQDTPGASA
ncbi:MAG: hypothetical protein D6706_10170 [Chloroflexi bacterium]|nr:MAG: hypothetical protein D6706_10170 [Chloroflexota bacterium]